MSQHPAAVTLSEASKCMNIFMCWHAGSVQTSTVEMASMQGDPADFFQHPALLGSNLYDRDRPRQSPPKGRRASTATAQKPTAAQPAPPSPVKVMATATSYAVLCYSRRKDMCRVAVRTTCMRISSVGCQAVLLNCACQCPGTRQIGMIQFTRVKANRTSQPAI